MRRPRHDMAPAVGSTSRSIVLPERRFAAAAFPNQAQRFTLGNREADVVDRMHRAPNPTENSAVNGVMLGQGCHLEQRAGSLCVALVAKRHAAASPSIRADSQHAA